LFEKIVIGRYFFLLHSIAPSGFNMPPNFKGIASQFALDSVQQFFITEEDDGG
jgi:hypothetical protein